ASASILAFQAWSSSLWRRIGVGVVRINSRVLSGFGIFLSTRSCQRLSWSGFRRSIESVSRSSHQESKSRYPIPRVRLYLQLGVLLQLERLCEPVPREAALHCVDVVGKPIAVAFPLVVSLPSAYPLLVRPSRLKVRWVGFNFGYSVIITVLCIQALHHLDI